MLTKEQFYAKHEKSANWAKLSKAQKKERYQSYLASTPQAVAFRAAPKPKPKKIGSPSGGQGKGRAFVVNSGFKLNPKTHDFLTARMNPFCPRISDVGYPAGSPTGTLKTRCYARGALVCNAAGYGSIMMSTGACAAGISALQYSSNGATYAQATDAFPAIGALGTSSIALTGVPITQSVASAVAQVRIVGCGIRIRNTTAILNKGGSAKSVMYPVINSDMATLTGTAVLSTYRKYAGWYDLSCADSPWMSAVWQPTLPPESATAAGPNTACKVDGAFFNLNSTNTVNNNYDLGIIVSGAPNATFDFEVVEWTETLGSPTGSGNANDLLNTLNTPSTPDPLGRAIVTMSNDLMLANAQPKAADGGVTLSSIMDSVGQAARAVLGQSTPSDFMSSLLGPMGNGTEPALSAPTAEPSLSGWAADSSSGLLSDLESRFFNLTGREAGTAMESVGEALALLV